MRGSTVGLADGNLEASKMTYHNILLDAIDSLFSASVVAPLVVTYWRSTWGFMDIYLCPSNKIRSAIFSLIIGIIGHLIFTIGQGLWRNNFDPDRHRLTFYVGSRLYTLIFGVICVNHWRGGWQLIDTFTAGDVTTLLCITIPAIVALCALKGLRNITAAPFVVVTDHSRDYFDIPTMYKRSVSSLYRP